VAKFHEVGAIRCLRRARSSWQLNTVALGDPRGRVRPPAQRDPVVAELNVGTVGRCLGQFAYSVNEGQRLREVIESELALQRSVDLGPALAHTPKYRA
jgi:hypothetical protein